VCFEKNAGIVHQNVGAAKLAAQAGGQGRQRRLASVTSAMCGRTSVPHSRAIVGLHLRSLRQPRPTISTMHPAGGKVARHGEADATRGTGHDGKFLS
jgi:hypothetical protein